MRKELKTIFANLDDIAEKHPVSHAEIFELCAMILGQVLTERDDQECPSLMHAVVKRSMAIRTAMIKTFGRPAQRWLTKQEAAISKFLMENSDGDGHA